MDKKLSDVSAVPGISGFEGRQPGLSVFPGTIRPGNPETILISVLPFGISRARRDIARDDVTGVALFKSRKTGTCYGIQRISFLGALDSPFGCYMIKNYQVSVLYRVFRDLRGGNQVYQCFQVLSAPEIPKPYSLACYLSGFPERVEILLVMM